MLSGSQSSRTDDSVKLVFEKYADTVFKIAYARTNNSYDADDILQDVFIRYMKSKPEFENEEHEKAWFLRCAINCSKSLLTSAWFRKTAAMDDRFSTEMKEKSDVYYAVAELPADLRTIIHLYYYEGYRLAEIAFIMKKSEASVKSALFRARKKLRKKLEQNDERDDFDEL
ncbi:MAG: RNA polymerase sigma factor [Eubacteriales bacterium]|nr:RNA polymerase sigma factor [Eubacteriales bacterium]MDD4475435.1 RNA polymerase sigma factor [Eubacteriales bacterium]